MLIIAFLASFAYVAREPRRVSIPTLRRASPKKIMPVGLYALYSVKPSCEPTLARETLDKSHSVFYTGSAFETW